MRWRRVAVAKEASQAAYHIDEGEGPGRVRNVYMAEERMSSVFWMRGRKGAAPVRPGYASHPNRSAGRCSGRSGKDMSVSSS